MFRPRVIPCLLMKGTGLVKTTAFDKPVYIGDPINAVRIFNEKEVDELIFLDITQSRNPMAVSIQFDLLSKISRECFMPLSYGGGIKKIEDIEQLLKAGVEKVVINTALFETPGLITEGSIRYGTQCIIASIDVKGTADTGYEVLTRCGTQRTGKDPVEIAKMAERQGAGEIMITSIDRDGMMTGYDIDLVKRVSDAVGIPVIACGGAGNISHLKKVYEDGHASAVAAGSMFVFFGKMRAVLINYPEQITLNETFRDT